jgi:hypothetical protein
MRIAGRQDAIGMVLVKLFYKGFVFPHLPTNVFPVVMIIRQSSIDLGQAQLRIMRNDFVRWPSLLLVPHHDILDANAMPGDTRFSPADPGGLHNRAVGIVLHKKPLHPHEGKKAPLLSIEHSLREEKPQKSDSLPPDAIKDILTQKLPKVGKDVIEGEGTLGFEDSLSGMTSWEGDKL